MAPAARADATKFFAICFTDFFPKMTIIRKSIRKVAINKGEALEAGEEIQILPAKGHEGKDVCAQDGCHNNSNPKFFILEQRTNVAEFDKVKPGALFSGEVKQKQAADKNERCNNKGNQAY